jgi:hypothetical protein
MNILLDECVPKRLKKYLVGHAVKTVVEMGWNGIKNGNLLKLAEPYFEVFITVDQNLRYQQNLRGFNLAIMVLIVPDNKIDSFLPLLDSLNSALLTSGKATVTLIGRK